MSRVVFTNKDEFLKWIKSHCQPSQYEVYFTSFAEIIMAPTKSTRSLRYALIEIYPYWDSAEQARNEVSAAIPAVEIYTIKAFDWDSTRNIGVK